MNVHEKSTVFRQGKAMPFSWTEVGFIMDCLEGITLRINLTAEKKRESFSYYKTLIKMTVRFTVLVMLYNIKRPPMSKNKSAKNKS